MQGKAVLYLQSIELEPLNGWRFTLFSLIHVWNLEPFNFHIASFNSMKYPTYMLLIKNTVM